MKTVSQVVELVKNYYKTNQSGGSLHIVLDDGNTETNHVVWCLLCAHDEGDKEGEDLPNVLLELSKEERDSVYEKYDEYNPW